MKTEYIQFPVSSYLENNKLIKIPDNILDNSGYAHKVKLLIRRSFDFFLDQEIRINYISPVIHEKLTHTSNLITLKRILKETNESTGLLILPETIYPDFTHVKDFTKKVNNLDYPINAIFYSWLTFDNHDKICGTYSDEEAKNDTKNKDLLIIPLHNQRITQATDTYFLINNDDLYGEKYNANHRQWYGKILDYVMSFLILDNITNNENHIEEPGIPKLIYQKVEYDQNKIEFVQ